MINVHASLLPALRGAAPINWAILRGDADTGITVMQMEAGMDSGPILRQAVTPIGMNETAGELTTRLAALGAETLIESLALLQMGRLRPTPQDESRVSFAPKIGKEAVRLDWNESAAAVARKIRAFDPTPGAWSFWKGHQVKLFGPITVAGDRPPGQVVSTAPLTVAARTGVVEVAEVIPSGRGRMSGEAWCRGQGPKVGDYFR
jgi:methionyl-tRNA formyltransferase